MWNKFNSFIHVIRHLPFAVAMFWGPFVRAWSLTFNMHSCARYLSTGAQPALNFRGGGQFSWNFIRWCHLAYSTVVQFFCKQAQIKSSSQHYRIWELFSFNQDADRAIRTEQKLVAKCKHLLPYSASALIAVAWQCIDYWWNCVTFRLVLENSSNPLSRFLKLQFNVFSVR